MATYTKVFDPNLDSELNKVPSTYVTVPKAPKEFEPLDFVPENLHRFEFYREIAELIKFAVGEYSFEHKPEFDPIIKALRLNTEHPDAVNAWFYTYIKPVLGTHQAMKIAFNLLDLKGDIAEWWDEEIPLSPFKFTVTFDQYPSNMDVETLINFIKALKNERSHLTSVRMRDCPDILVLDQGILDQDFLSSSAGYYDPNLGVLICFTDRLAFYYNWELNTGFFGQVNSLSNMLSIWSYYYNYASGTGMVLDEFDISYAIGVDDFPYGYSMGAITATQAFITPGDFQILQPGSIFQSIHETQIRHLYPMQLALDEWGTLSGGEGFMGLERWPLETQWQYPVPVQWTNKPINDPELMPTFTWDWVKFGTIYYNFSPTVYDQAFAGQGQVGFAYTYALTANRGEVGIFGFNAGIPDLVVDAQLALGLSGTESTYEVEQEVAYQGLAAVESLIPYNTAAGRSQGTIIIQDYGSIYPGLSWAQADTHGWTDLYTWIDYGFFPSAYLTHSQEDEPTP